MKIIILGAGQVGTSVAANLASEANDITVVDQDPELLQALQDKLDLRTLKGYAAHPDVLEQAGCDDAEMVIAVTNNDETNMVACQVAWTLFHTPRKIARVRAIEYHRHPALFNQGGLPIDVLISPEQLVTEYIQRLLDYPGALQVLDFAGGLVQLVGLRAYEGGPLVGHQLRELNQHLHGGEARVAAIYREGKAIHPTGDTVIEPDDEVFFIAAAQNIQAVMAELRREERPYRRLIFAGGGNIGRRLAARLEDRFRVKIIERDPERARAVAEELRNTIVLQGDAADEDLLLEENIEDTDVFCAVTNDDEANILSAMLAKRLHSLRRGAAEAIEAIAHGDRDSSSVVGRRVEEVKLPKGTSIGAIVRGEKVIIAHHDTVIEPEDHVILFLVDKRRIGEVEKLFQVGITFL